MFTASALAPLKAYDYQDLVVSAAAVGLDATKLAVTVVAGSTPDTGIRWDKLRRAEAIIFTIDSAVTDSVRLRIDGTDPTATVGHLFTGSSAGGGRVIIGYANLVRLRFIRTAAVDVTVRITFLRKE